MRNSAFGYLLILLVFLPFVFNVAWAQTGADQQPANCRLSGVVRHLGRYGTDVNNDFDSLAQAPHQAVRLLVAQLHSVPHKVYYPGSKDTAQVHVVACLRALRYLTGKSFTARTNTKLTDDEKQFLCFDKQMHDANPYHKIHFFGVWMSRDADFLAPLDAQLNIIKQWRQWEKVDGQTFKYKPFRKSADAIDDWYWFG